MTRWLCAAALLIATAGAGEGNRAPVDPDKPADAPAGEKLAVPAEYTLTVKEGEWRVRVTLRPGQAEQGKLVEMLLDVSRHPEVPDPQYGDRIPLQNARLQVSMSGAGRPERHRLWPMGDAGVYGTHFTPSARGLWTVVLSPINARDEGLLPRVEFQLGVGVPMPASSEGQAVRSTRVVRAGGPALPEPGQADLGVLMKQMAGQWVLLGRGLPDADEKAALAALAPLLAQLPGNAPRGAARESAEFDNIARKLRNDVDLYAASEPAARPQLAQALGDTCFRCHLKFRDGVVSDLSKWPEVQPWRK